MMAMFKVDTSELNLLVSKFLADAPQAVRSSLRRTVGQAGQLVAEDAKPRTSARVAATITVTTSGTGGGSQKITAVITAGNSETPEAALLEGDGTPGTWRHPLFGNRDHWYEEARKPFLHPARDAQQQNGSDLIVGGAADAVRAALGSS